MGNCSCVSSPPDEESIKHPTTRLDSPQIPMNLEHHNTREQKHNGDEAVALLQDVRAQPSDGHLQLERAEPLGAPALPHAGCVHAGSTHFGKYFGYENEFIVYGYIRTHCDIVILDINRLCVSYYGLHSKSPVTFYKHDNWLYTTGFPRQRAPFEYDYSIC